MDTATSIASVRTIAHDGKPSPLEFALIELEDRVGALVITVNALEERLRPITRTGYEPGEAVDPDDRPRDVDPRSSTVRNLSQRAEQITGLRARVDELLDRLEV